MPVLALQRQGQSQHIMLSQGGITVGPIESQPRLGRRSFTMLASSMTKTTLDLDVGFVEMLILKKEACIPRGMLGEGSGIDDRSASQPPISSQSINQWNSINQSVKQSISQSNVAWAVNQSTHQYVSFREPAACSLSTWIPAFALSRATSVRSLNLQLALQLLFDFLFFCVWLVLGSS